jgi:hypothetical protein
VEPGSQTEQELGHLRRSWRACVPQQSSKALTFTEREIPKILRSAVFMGSFTRLKARPWIDSFRALSRDRQADEREHEMAKRLPGGELHGRHDNVTSPPTTVTAGVNFVGSFLPVQAE